MKGRTGPMAQATQCAMGTVMTHKAYGQYADDSVAAVCREVEWLEKVLSRFVPDSEISRINRAAGIKREKVSLETLDVLAKSAEFSRRLAGCFDVTIAPLVTLWKTARESGGLPDEPSVRQAIRLVNHGDLLLDPQGMTAKLRRVGQGVDLGGIGKGCAGDKLVQAYRVFGISSAYSNLGGNVVTVGTKPDGSAWRVGIQHPRHEDGLVGSVEVVNETVVTSGDYQRCWTDSQGRRHHHILDPRTGYPADSGLVSVSIVAAKSLAADVLSTAVFVAGMDKGLAFLRGFPGTEAILVDTGLRAYVTSGLRDRFQAGEGIDVTILD